MANEDKEADDLDRLLPGINRMQYYIRDPKARATASSFPATAPPLQDSTTIRLLRDIHIIQLNLARESKGVADHVNIETTLKNDIKVKDSHIAALNDHAQALQSRATIIL
jgi:hypothetical protein